MRKDEKIAKRCLKPEVVKKVNKGVNKEKKLEDTLGQSSVYLEIQE